MSGIYVSPEVEIIEVCVESGFASTEGSTTEDYIEGGTIIL